MSTNSWVCSNEPSHIYNDLEADQNGYFCPKCAFGEGILMKTTVSNTSNPTPITHEEDLGLCIMLLDCSGSMREPGFANHPLTKKQLVAKGAAAGIFSLSGNMLKEFAYLLILGFDHNVITILPYTTVKDVIETYKDASTFEQFIFSKMDAINGATNINEALKIASTFAEQFVNGEISSLGNYKPRIQTVMDNNMASHQIPNVRVVLFTDGEHYVGSSDTVLKPNPFKNISGCEFDLLMCAYYGQKSENGFAQLETLVSKCPIHSETNQLFLFDDPTKIPVLKGLFRMASGASGFCPTCFEESNKVAFDPQ